MLQISPCSMLPGLSSKNTLKRPIDDDPAAHQESPHTRCKKICIMPPPRTINCIPALSEPHFEFMNNPSSGGYITPRPVPSTGSSGGSRSLDADQLRPYSRNSLSGRRTSEISFDYVQPGASRASAYEEPPTDSLRLQPQNLTLSTSTTSLVPTPLAEPVFPGPAADPESNVFKPEPMLHLNGQAMQHLSILKEVRGKVAQTLRHRILRRVSAGRLSQEAADALLKTLLSRLAKPVSIALQRYCAAKRYFSEGQFCLAREELIDGSGALGLYSKDIEVITEGLANAIAKAAVQAEGMFIQQKQEYELEQQRLQQQEQHCSTSGLTGEEPSLGNTARLSTGGIATPMSQLTAEPSLDMSLGVPKATMRHRLSFCGMPDQDPDLNPASVGSGPCLNEQPTPRFIASTPSIFTYALPRSSSSAPASILQAPESAVVAYSLEDGHAVSYAYVRRQSSISSSCGNILANEYQGDFDSSVHQGCLQQVAHKTSGLFTIAASSEAQDVRCSTPSSTCREGDAQQQQLHPPDLNPKMGDSSPGFLHEELCQQTMMTSNDDGRGRFCDVGGNGSSVYVQEMPYSSPILATPAVPLSVLPISVYAPKAEVPRMIPAGSIQHPSSSIQADAPGGELDVERTLSGAMAGAFVKGLESMDWLVSVQDAYGLDPEELLLQQRGIEEEEEEEEDHDHHHGLFQQASGSGGRRISMISSYV